ncbi:MAG: shikimate kinase [Burkholderiaceae bacterium]
MGAGKTTVGRKLAARLSLEFVDSDHELEVRCGVPVATIFAVEGEAAFRDREAKLIDELTQRPGIVLATGGGAVLRPENRQHLRSRGTVIYLHAEPLALFHRTKHDRGRPLLQTTDPLAKLQELYAQRHPLYEETAHYTFNTGKPSVRELVERIVEVVPVKSGT